MSSIPPFTSTSEPHAQIHVRNLQTQLPLSTDAWGRPSKSQPILISTTVSLKQPFSSAASTDEVVTGSTVHYGILSKRILGFCDEYRTSLSDATSQGKDGSEKDKPVVSGLREFTSSLINSLLAKQKGEDVALLNLNDLERLSISVLLPKASLLGNGVRYTQMVRGRVTAGEMITHVEMKERIVLSVEGLKIPCLIGVNDIERTAKQVVVATVNVEGDDAAVGPYVEEFVKLESVVVKAIGESSFKTLETLTSHLTNHIITEFMVPIEPRRERDGDHFPKIRIVLEKPTAVTFADAPAVEVLVDTDPKVNADMGTMWKGWMKDV